MRSSLPLLAVAAVHLAACGSSSSADADAAPDAPAEAAVTVLATTDGAGAVLFDGQTVFWSSADALWRVERDGSGQLELAAEPTHAAALTLASDRLLWVTPGSHGADFRNGAVRAVPVAGGAIEELAVRQFPIDLAIHEERVYWSEIDGGWLASSRLDGGDVQELAWAETGFPSVAAGPAGLVWATSGNATASILLQRPGADAAEPLAEDQTSPGDLIVAGDEVFFTSHFALGGEPATVQRARLDGSGAEALVTDLELRPGIALDESHLYLADPAAGSIGRVLRSGGAVEILATDQPEPLALAVRGSTVVFACGDGSVRRLDL